MPVCVDYKNIKNDVHEELYLFEAADSAFFASSEQNSANPLFPIVFNIQLWKASQSCLGFDFYWAIRCRLTGWEASAVKSSTEVA
jgi:hypothetical protein